MVNIKNAPKKLMIRIAGMDDEMARYSTILKYKKDKLLVTKIMGDIYRLELDLMKLGKREKNNDIFKQP